VLECKNRDINTAEVREALDFLEPHIQPTWLVPQYRHALDEPGDQGYDQDAQQQVLRPSFDGIRKSVRDLLAVLWINRRDNSPRLTTCRSKQRLIA
jgi:hypothetical protein